MVSESTKSIAGAYRRGLSPGLIAGAYRPKINTTNCAYGKY